MVETDSDKSIGKYSMNILKYFLYYSIILLFSSNYEAKAQLLDDKEALTKVQKSIQSIYNFEFDKADHTTDLLSKQYPGHPVVPLLHSFKMYWELLPIQSHPKELQTYIKLLQDCLTAIDKYYGSDSRNPEAVFYTIVARGYLAMCYNYQNELLKAAIEAKKAYNALIRGQSLIQYNPEFYFTSGIYNYYMEVYPNKKPIIKPVIWFFKKGDKSGGINQLMMASQKAIISKAEANFYLSHIFLEYENQHDNALKYSQKLNNTYPANPVYRMIYLESLLLTGKYEVAEQLLKAKPLPKQMLYQIATQLFQGYLAEKLHNRPVEAESFYKKAISLPLNDQYTGEYQALAYAGLARLARRQGNDSQAKEYYKKCLKTAEYKSTVHEANKFLNQ